MSGLPKDVWLGAGVIAFGAFLFFVLIPYGITSPANVRIAVLSPTIWPNIISVILMLIGGLILGRAIIARDVEPAAQDGTTVGWWPWVRIAFSAALMAGLFYSLPILGMPITSSLTIFAYAVMVRAGRPVITVLTAIFLPLIIYGFFSHVAGVPIPQGKILRLP
jgi:hypothetical protein